MLTMNIIFGIINKEGEYMIDEIMKYLYLIPCAIIAVVLHELAHGLVSYWLGDPTPKETGRLSINPSKHLDIMGVICLIFFGFGWAKPVVINPMYYKKPKWGIALVSLAGPLMNFIIMILSFVFMWIILKLQIYVITNPSEILNMIYEFFTYLAIINLGLGLFNLIPIPPLDGSKIIGCILPEKAYNEYMGYQKYGTFFIIGLLMLLYILESFNIASPLNILMDKILLFFYEIMFKLL